MTNVLDKYVVERRDGRPLENMVFVLSPETDDVALDALIHYKEHTKDRQLRIALDTWIRAILKSKGAEWAKEVAR
jgi:hypothetical protein